MNNRYKFIKKLYSDYLIILITKSGNYTSFGRDLILLNYLNVKKKYLFKNLKKYHINYLLVDNLDVVSEGKYDDNNYYKFIKISYLSRVLIRLKQGKLKIIAQRGEPVQQHCR